jgi:hypothetical protein
MNAKVIQYSIFTVLAILAACRKELPNLPDAEAPVFFFQASGDGLDINMQAGVNTAQYSDELIIQNAVPVYSGSVFNDDEMYTFKFFAGEVFRDMTAQEFLSLNSIVPISMNTPLVQLFEVSSLTSSEFDNASVTVDDGNPNSSFGFLNPGKYQMKISASRNGFDVELNNTTIVAYTNPYKFELIGNINSSGPGIILEGSISNNTENITRVDWICGTNTQTTTVPSVQFPPAGSGNILTAIVYFADGTTRTRSIALGFQNAPKIQDYVYDIEQNSVYSFSQKFVLEFIFNGQYYTSLSATEFSSGQPYLNISEKTLYTDPVTQEQAYLIKANGLVYVKNTSTNQTIPLNLNMSFGLPIEF